MNVLISVNNNYLDKAKTLLFSLRCHTQRNATVYLMNHALSIEELNGFEEYLSAKCKMALRILDVSNTALDKLPIGNLNFTIETYYRLIAQFLLPKEVDRILWLDADMIIMGDASPFYDLDFEGKSYIVCPDSKGESSWVCEAKNKIGIPAEHIYFNAGVLLMNIEKLRNETDINHIVEVCYQLEERLTYFDQDILNYLYQHDVKYTDWKKYNYQLIDIDRIKKEEIKQIVMLHYCGGRKPWNYWQLNNTSKYYWKVKIRQGDWKEAISTYWRKIKEITTLYLREMKGLLF